MIKKGGSDGEKKAGKERGMDDGHPNFWDEAAPEATTTGTRTLKTC